MKNIYSLTLSDATEKLCLPRSKAVNIFRDIYRDKAESYAEMTHTAAEIKERLAREYEFVFPKAVKKQDSGDSVKYLFLLSDGNMIESVLMRQKYGGSVCVSSQAGCNMGCIFCNSGKRSKVRDLCAGEMVTQLLYIEKDQGIRITNAAVMGIGEPFDNFENVSDFCDIVTDDNGLAIPPSRVTVSTCGLPDGIDGFSEIPRPCSLAISLHSADEKTRSFLMPINKKYPIAEVIDAARRYIQKTGRRVLLEYTLLSGINDGTNDADMLAKLIGGEDFTVNLIEYNPTGGEFTKSIRFFEFYDELKKRGLRVTVRRKFGEGINAACGQLRSAAINEREMK